MTYKEAKNFIWRNHCAENCPNMACGECPYDFAIKAIEKQIPQFVNCPNGFLGDRYTRYLCPNCGKNTRQRESCCHNCGQAVKYPKEIYDRENNRIVLDWSEKE